MFASNTLLLAIKVIDFGNVGLVVMSIPLPKNVTSSSATATRSACPGTCQVLNELPRLTLILPGLSSVTVNPVSLSNLKEVT